MSLLIDTNVLVWIVNNDPRLSRRVADRLLDGKEEAFVSVVSGWEYGQKRLVRPGELPLSFDDILSRIPHRPLHLSFGVYRYAETLPLIHKDPFDRMLIAQAIYHDLTFIASDDDIAKYPVKTFW